MNLTLQKPWFHPIFLIFFVLCSKINISEGPDTIISGQSLYGSQTIISKKGNFELGFFKPGKSQNYYIGIWYARLPQAYNKVVWVANRNQPISDPLSSSELKLFPDGNLVLQNQSKKPVWLSNSSSKNSNSTFIALLLDNGNFVIRDALDSSTVIWQSFEHPTDTWLPGGKLGYNKLRNENISLSPWRSPENPATSLFSLVAYGRSYLALWNNSVMYWTSGEWNGKYFPLIPETVARSNDANVTYVTNENESYFSYETIWSFFIRIVIDITGQVQIYVWWGDSLPQFVWAQPLEYCDVYAVCGAFSSCNGMGPIVCNCMPGFEPKVPEDWELGDHTDGCVRKTPLRCNKEGSNTFITIPNTRFPSNGVPLLVERVEECEQTCLTDCSCTAYAYNNSGCFFWKGDILNLQQVSSDDVTGGNFYVRVAASKHMLADGVNQKRNIVLIVFIVVGSFFTSFCILSGSIWRRRLIEDTFEGSLGSLMVFQYREIRIATKNFSKKLGEGSFGVVFKGTLPNSTAIAVKRLKVAIQQDNKDKQFRAEVSTIGRIQHINLVRLRGFCVRGAERFLVYDYMSNGTLESYLFEKGSNFLEWKTRYNIAIGIARGLAYIHERCRDCIVHCDIKPENILLDDEYNPKVADFGLAKLIGRDFSRVLTTVRGTIGYLAPEWITGEAITQKADVFSFGMVLFEIISGRRNRDMLGKGTDKYFPSQVAHQITTNGDVFDLLDQKLEGNADKEQLTRGCRVACWCIQDFEKNRPSMGQVVQILEGVIDVNIPLVPQFLQGLAPWIHSGPSTMDSIAINTLT